MKKNLRFNRILMKKISFKRTLHATQFVLLSTTVFAQFMDASNERVKTPFYKKMGFWISECGFRISECGFRNVDFGFRNVDFGFRNVDFGFRNVDFGMWIRISESV